MIPLNIMLEGDNAFPEAKGAAHGLLTGVARLQHGMESGGSSVGLHIVLDDGSHVIAETSMNLFLAAARAFNAREEMKEQGHG